MVVVEVMVVKDLKVSLVLLALMEVKELKVSKDFLIKVFKV